jgi:hypothetical protein
MKSDLFQSSGFGFRVSGSAVLRDAILFPGCPGVEPQGYSRPSLRDGKIEILCAFDGTEGRRLWGTARRDCWFNHR